MSEKQNHTPLKSRIEQMLTEARVIIPGGQALLGFQLIATLTKAFKRIAGGVQIYPLRRTMRRRALGGALDDAGRRAPHWIPGRRRSDVFRIGSSLVIAASIPLAIGIAANVTVVFFKATESTGAAWAAGATALVALLAFWLAYPAWRRNYLIRHS